MSQWMKARETLPILNAYFLPNGGEKYLYPDITPVNSFRLILDLYFGTDLGLLEDRSYLTNYQVKYDLICDADGILPDISPPEIWAEITQKALEEHDYHLAIQDCDFERHSV